MIIPSTSGIGCSVRMLSSLSTGKFSGSGTTDPLSDSGSGDNLLNTRIYFRTDWHRWAPTIWFSGLYTSRPNGSRFITVPFSSANTRQERTVYPETPFCLIRVSPDGTVASGFLTTSKGLVASTVRSSFIFFAAFWSNTQMVNLPFPMELCEVDSPRYYF